MLPLNTSTLREQIVLALASEPYQSAKDLHVKLCDAKGSHGYSLQAVYKQLRQLEVDGVLTKAGKEYVVNLTWIADVLAFTSKVQESYFKTASAGDSLPAKGKKLRWKFSNLLQLKPFWSQLVLEALQVTEENLLLSWNPHPWFYLVNTAHQQSMMEALRRNGARMYKMIGGNTYLDRLCSSYWDKSIVQHSFAQGPFHEKRNVYFSVVGDYVIKVELTQKVANRIDEVFQSVSLHRDLDLQLLFSVLSDSAKVSLSVQRSEVAARRYRKQFEDFFGRLEA